MWFIDIILILFILISVGLALFILTTQRLNKSKPRVLMLHQVDQNVPPSGMNIAPQHLEQFIIYLQQAGYSFYTISELVDLTNHRKTIALTFDDGFEDNFTYLFPLLKKYHIKATIYLAPNITNIAKLSNHQIKIMQHSGLVEFGAHTVHHVNLKTIPNNTAYQEISESKKIVEQMTGVACNSFAYPFGRFLPEETPLLVEKAGFLTAVTTKKRIKTLNQTNQFLIPRISINGTMSLLQLKIALIFGRYKL